MFDEFAEDDGHCPMTIREAALEVATVKNQAAAMRASLLRLHDRMGWRALGYTSWLEMGQREFGLERRYMYRLLDAAKVERNLGLTVSYPEGMLRELVALPNADLQKEAFEFAKRITETKEYPDKAAVHRGKLTAVIMRQAVQAIQRREAGDVEEEPDRTNHAVRRIAFDGKRKGIRLSVEVGNKIISDFWTLEELKAAGIRIMVPRQKD